MARRSRRNRGGSRRPLLVVGAVVVVLAAGALAWFLLSDDGDPGAPRVADPRGRVSELQAQPCALVDVAAASDAVGRRVTVRTDAPAQTCALQLRRGGEDRVSVSPFGPTNPDDLAARLPGSEAVPGVGDAARWEAFPGGGGRLVATDQRVGVSVVMQLNRVGAARQREIAERIATRALVLAASGERLQPDRG